MGGVFVLYLLGTVISYPKIKDKSCLSCERFVNDCSGKKIRPGNIPLLLTHTRQIWNNIG